MASSAARLQHRRSPHHTGQTVGHPATQPLPVCQMGREYSSVPACLLLWSCLATQQPAAQSALPASVPKTLWGVGANQTKVGGDAILGRYLNKTGPGGLDQAVKPLADIMLLSECLCRFVCGHGKGASRSLPSPHNLAYLAINLELQSRDWLYHDSNVTKFIQDHHCCPLCSKSALLSSDSPLRSQQSKQKHLCNRLNVSCSQLGGAGLAGAALSALGCRLPQPPLLSHHHVSHSPRVRVGGAGEPAVTRTRPPPAARPVAPPQ